jgi:GntR family transcriptional repressor for pyruvate dehydrogenase complex
MENFPHHIIRQNVTDQVVEYLRANIENKVWLEGEKIPSENQMTDMLNVSRASIRAAISQLVGVGVLESIQGKGTYVITNNIEALGQRQYAITKEDCKEIIKVLEFRIIIEPHSSHLAAQRATEDNIQKLSGLLEEMKSAVGDPKRFICADMSFHEELCHATQNPLIEKSIQEVFRQTEYSHNQINAIFGYDGIYYHENILAAIRKKNGREASKIMKEHLQHALDSLITMGIE